MLAISAISILFYSCYCFDYVYCSRLGTIKNPPYLITCDLWYLKIIHFTIRENVLVKSVTTYRRVVWECQSVQTIILYDFWETPGPDRGALWELKPHSVRLLVWQSVRGRPNNWRSPNHSYGSIPDPFVLCTQLPALRATHIGPALALYWASVFDVGPV